MILYHCQIGQTYAEYSAATWRTQRKRGHKVGGGLRSLSVFLVIIIIIKL